MATNLAAKTLGGNMAFNYTVLTFNYVITQCEDEKTAWKFYHEWAKGTPSKNEKGEIIPSYTGLAIFDERSKTFLVQN